MAVKRQKRSSLVRVQKYTLSGAGRKSIVSNTPAVQSEVNGFPQVPKQTFEETETKKTEREKKKLELSESFNFFHNQVLLSSQSGSPLKDQLEKALKQIDNKLDKLGGIGAYKGRKKTLAEKRQLQREIRERAKEWLREQESSLRKILVAKYQDVRKKAIKKSFEELEKAGEIYLHEIKRRKEKITEMIDNNIKRRINVEIEKVKIQEWTPEVVLAKVMKEFKKATRDDLAMLELEKTTSGSQLGKDPVTTSRKHNMEKKGTVKTILPAIVVARKRGRRISQIKVDNARDRGEYYSSMGFHEKGDGHENTFGIDLTNQKGKSAKEFFRASAHTSSGIVHMMHKTRKPMKTPYQKQHMMSKVGKEDLNYLSDGERVKISDYLTMEGPLNAQKFPRLQQLVYLSLPFCNLGYTGIKNLSDILHVCKNLKHLDVSGNEIDPESLQLLLGSVENSRDLPIHSIDLSSNNIGSGSIEGVRAIISLIRSPRKHKIRVLGLRATFLSLSSMKMLLGFLKDNKSLKEINLAENGIQDKGAMVISDMLSSNKSLEKLDIAYNDITSAGVEILSKALEGNVHNNLKCLDISWNPLHDEGVSTLVKLLPASKIEELHIDSCRCTDASCLNLAECILKYGSNLDLKALTIIQNKYFGPGGMKLQTAASKYGIKVAKDASLAQLRNTEGGKTRFDKLPSIG